MVSATLLLLALSAAAPDAALGVVRVPRGEVSVATPEGTYVPAVVGTLLSAGAAVEVAETGWAELMLAQDVRLRLSAGTHVRLRRGQDAGLELELARGRVWVQRSRSDTSPVHVRGPGLWVEVQPSSSSIVEHNTLSGGSCVVRAGAVRVSVGAAPPVTVPAGMIARESRPGEARTGGQTIGELVAKEAQAGLGDLPGLTAFIVRRTLDARVADVDMRGVGVLLQGDAQIMGGSHAGLIVERAVRPPPFEPGEVPARGANVEVEVRFEDR